MKAVVITTTELEVDKLQELAEHLNTFSDTAAVCEGTKMLLAADREDQLDENIMLVEVTLNDYEVKNIN